MAIARGKAASLGDEFGSLVAPLEKLSSNKLQTIVDTPRLTLNLVKIFCLCN